MLYTIHCVSVQLIVSGVHTNARLRALEGYKVKVSIAGVPGAFKISYFKH